MELKYENYIISDDSSQLQFEKTFELLTTTYWAKNRSRDIIRKSMENSICFGVYLDGIQIGFARCVTDYSTVYWLCDVIIGPEHRRKGIADALVGFIAEHKDLRPLMGILSTKHSKALYSKHGFKLSTNGFMLKSMPKIQTDTPGGI